MTASHTAHRPSGSHDIVTWVGTLFRLCLSCPDGDCGFGAARAPRDVRGSASQSRKKSEMLEALVPRDSTSSYRITNFEDTMCGKPATTGPLLRRGAPVRARGENRR